MPYENYTLEEFLADREFKNWVLNPDNNSRLFWKKWMDSHPGQKATIIKARELMLSYQFMEPEAVCEEEKEAILEGILAGQVKRRLTEPRLGYWVAAAVALLFTTVVFAFYHLNRTTEPAIAMVVKENPPGRKSTITLPDGSRVWLNSDSRITFPDRFIHSRVVHLEGEAYFEVVKNAEKPFKVLSGGVVTTALGTSFNVRAYDRQPEIEVLLVTGRVSVERNKEDLGQQDRVIINPGEKAIYNIHNHTLDKATYADHRAVLWKDGIISFRKAGYPEIKERLERWYGVEIESEGLHRDLSYTADFTNESLERVLERMGFTEKFTFEIIEGKVKLKFE